MPVFIQDLIGNNIIAGAFIFMLWYIVQKQDKTLTSISNTLKDISDGMLMLNNRVDQLEKKGKTNMQASIIAPIVAVFALLLKNLFGVELGDSEIATITDGIVAIGLAVVAVYGVIKNHKKKDPTKQ